MPVSKAQQKAVSKYMKNNYDEIKLRIPKGEKERVQALAAKREQSVNAMVWQMIEEELNKHGE